MFKKRRLQDRGSVCRPAGTAELCPGRGGLAHGLGARHSYASSNLPRACAALTQLMEGKTEPPPPSSSSALQSPHPPPALRCAPRVRRDGTGSPPRRSHGSRQHPGEHGLRSPPLELAPVAMRWVRDGILQVHGNPSIFWT